ncbi:MAG: putative F420-dependent oxidoreductase [Acidimicrobiales bacterium]|jgi:F420-dependent oxidoreductase-like protein|nr:putative F420-dependent oxidoreductase [Acidimicrobiales bacterium]
MRLGLNLAYSGPSAADNVELVQFAESLGYHSVWTAEAYGSDAVVPLTWLGAHTSTIKLGTGIMQMPGRSPAMTAMTAATLDAYSGGRMLLGLGLSGPQVAEGWHGVPYGKPLGKTREYVEIVRAVLARDAPLEHHGEHYDIPYTGADATGLGKPLKSILHPRKDIPIYLAAIGPKNVALAAEIADGWLPIFFSPARWRDVFGASVGERDLSTFDIAPTATVVLGDDVDACRSMVKPFLALYVGGMGARGRNFYNDLACRYGFEGAAKEIQDLYLDGKKAEAAAAVPDSLVDAVALCGPKGRIAELVEEWKASPVTTMIVGAAQREALELMAELVL